MLLAPVVTVAAGTTWGHATPCYASHMMLVLLYGYGRMVCTGTKIKNFFIVVLIPKPFLKFPDKLIGKGCPTTGVLSTRYVERKTADSISAPRRNIEADSAAP